MRKLCIIISLLLLTLAASAQSADKEIEEQKRVIANLEKQLARDEQELSKIKAGKSTQESQVRRLNSQIASRTELIAGTEKQIRLLRDDINKTDSESKRLSAQLEQMKSQYASMVRDAYRNYKQNNYLSYLFSAHNFQDVARRIVNLREVAQIRAQKMEDIRKISRQVAEEQARLTSRKRSLDVEKNKQASQRKKLQRDVSSNKEALKKMSAKERAILKQKLAQEQQLEVAINELRKLTKGNKEGDSFTASTSNLHIPVVGGNVKKYKGNMAEIIGPRNARIISIYEGKIIDIKRNRITNKYEVYVAHGEYLTTYANLSAVSVQKGAKVAKDQQIGVIGSAVDSETMATEYKIVFGIYAPTPGQTMYAANCFK